MRIPALALAVMVAVPVARGLAQDHDPLEVDEETTLRVWPLDPAPEVDEADVPAEEPIAEPLVEPVVERDPDLDLLGEPDETEGERDEPVDVLGVARDEDRDDGEEEAGREPRSVLPKAVRAGGGTSKEDGE